MDVRTTIETGDVGALQRLLAADPALSNTPIRRGKNDEILTQPLHFVCDKVFDGTLPSGHAVSISKEVDAGGTAYRVNPPTGGELAAD